MSNKNLLLGLLLAWLAGSIWWQKCIIMNCAVDTNTKAINTDSLALAHEKDSLAALASIKADTIITDTNTLASPVAGITEDELAKNEKYSSVYKPMNLYFHTNDANYIKTDENQKFLKEAKAFLAEHKDKTLTLVGHTDSDGADEANQRLSEKRSKDVKGQFLAKGFIAEQLIADAKGETQPAASNDTPEGKKANRRVTIVVNQ